MFQGLQKMCPTWNTGCQNDQHLADWECLVYYHEWPDEIWVEKQGIVPVEEKDYKNLEKH